MGKQAPKALKPEQILGLARQQNFMSNPNVSNRFGTTTTTFDENDQASISQQLSPELNNIVDQQFDFLSQGPAQLGNFNSPFISGMLQGTANQIARRGGFGVPDASQMGGFDGNMPTISQDAAAPMDLPGGSITIPEQQEQRPPARDILAGALSQMAGSQTNPYSQASQSAMEAMQRWRDRSQKGGV